MVKQCYCRSLHKVIWDQMTIDNTDYKNTIMDTLLLNTHFSPSMLVDTPAGNVPSQVHRNLTIRDREYREKVLPGIRCGGVHLRRSGICEDENRKCVQLVAFTKSSSTTENPVVFILMRNGTWNMKDSSNCVWLYLPKRSDLWFLSDIQATQTSNK